MKWVKFNGIEIDSESVYRQTTSYTTEEEGTKSGSRLIADVMVNGIVMEISMEEDTGALSLMNMETFEMMNIEDKDINEFLNTNVRQ